MGFVSVTGASIQLTKIRTFKTKGRKPTPTVNFIMGSQSGVALSDNTNVIQRIKQEDLDRVTGDK